MAWPRPWAFVPVLATWAAVGSPVRAAAAADLHAAVKIWSAQADRGAERCATYAAASFQLWQGLEPIASDDVSWLPQALGLLERYPGASWGQQVLDNALLHDLPADDAPAAYEASLCSPSAYAYGMQRVLDHLRHLPGHEPLRARATAILLQKAMHDLAQPCPPLVLVTHQGLLAALQAQQSRIDRRSARLLAAADRAIDEAMVFLGLRDPEADEAVAADPSALVPHDELVHLEPGRKLLVQLVAEEMLARHL